MTNDIAPIKKTSYPVIWTKFENIDVKHIKGSSLVAVPVSGKKGSARFDIVETKGHRECLCQLLKKDVDYWLLTAHRAELIKAIDDELDAEQLEKNTNKAPTAIAQNDYKQLSFL